MMVCHAFVTSRVAKWIYVIGFVMGDEGRNNCYWLGLVHLWGHKDHIDTHVDQGFARVSLMGSRVQWILLDDCTYINFNGLEISPTVML